MRLGLQLRWNALPPVASAHWQAELGFGVRQGAGIVGRRKVVRKVQPFAMHWVKVVRVNEQKAPTIRGDTDEPP
jgi:hypothetical protein